MYKRQAYYPCEGRDGAPGHLHAVASHLRGDDSLEDQPVSYRQPDVGALESKEMCIRDRILSPLRSAGLLMGRLLLVTWRKPFSLSLIHIFHIERDEELARSDNGSSGCRVEARAAHVGLPVGVVFCLVLQDLVLSRCV